MAVKNISENKFSANLIQFGDIEIIFYKEKSKIEKLRRLDRSVKSIAASVAIAVEIIGVVIIVPAYPAYKFVAKKRKKKITPEILSLTDELMK